MTEQPANRLVTCICRRFPEDCDRHATQEDLLCDACRTGCVKLSVGLPDGRVPENAASVAHVGPVVWT